MASTALQNYRHHQTCNQVLSIQYSHYTYFYCCPGYIIIFLLTKQEGCTGEYLPQVMALQTEQQTANISKQCLSKQDKYLYVVYYMALDPYLIILNLLAFKAKNAWKQCVWLNMDQVRTNQNTQIYLRTTLSYSKTYYSASAEPSF